MKRCSSLSGICRFDVYIYILYIFPLASEERFLSFVAVPSGTNGGNLEAGHNVYTSQLYIASTVSSPLVILYSSNKQINVQSYQSEAIDIYDRITYFKNCRTQKMNNSGISVLYPDINLDLFFFYVGFNFCSWAY